ncbi:hypothetical protein DRP05_09900 [Archaeoglobales archaeon]|nr:MAG: hypothetical protein DRP05_09900 [Archaeoglobales archaeon]
MIKARTRISGLHASSKKPSMGEDVLFSGYLQVYDGELKRWDPLKGKLMLYVDGIKVRDFASDNYGYFEVEHTFNIPKKYDVEVRYDGSAKTKACMAGIKVEVLTEEQRRRVEKIIKMFGTVILLLLLLFLLLSLFMVFYR